MISKKKFWLSALVIAILGFAGGYLYSTKFCRVSIDSRVERSLGLNQDLRKLFSLYVFNLYNMIQAAHFKQPNVATFESQVRSNYDQISALMGNYYGSFAKRELVAIFNERADILHQMVEAGGARKFSDEWTKNSQRLTTLLAQLNPKWDSFIVRLIFSSEISSVSSIMQAFASRKWDYSYSLFSSYLNYALQIADELDSGILQQKRNQF
jgi:hypothetical protein